MNSYVVVKKQRRGAGGARRWGRAKGGIPSITHISHTVPLPPLPVLKSLLMPPSSRPLFAGVQQEVSGWTFSTGPGHLR
jgi:hypothetical protein